MYKKFHELVNDNRLNQNLFKFKLNFDNNQKDVFKSNNQKDVFKLNNQKDVFKLYNNIILNKLNDNNIKKKIEKIRINFDILRD